MKYVLAILISTLATVLDGQSFGKKPPRYNTIVTKIAIRLVVLICFLMSQLSISSFAQSMPCDSVYTMVDEAPMFKGGNENLVFLIHNLNYGDCGLNKKLILTWTVDRLGQMIDIDAPGFEGECKSRIITQLAKFPVWSPARVMGMPVCFKITIVRPANYLEEIRKRGF